LGNYLIYSVILAAFGTAGIVIFAGFALGSLGGSVINFLGARMFAFRPRE
jgi:hypothetical protein